MSLQTGEVGVPDDSLRLDRQLCFPLYAATNLITRLYGSVLTELGLTYPQYLVMLVLWEAEDINVGALGVRLHLDSGTLTPLLKRMESAGLLSRRRDMSDERRVLISLTQNGIALRERAVYVPAYMTHRFNVKGLDALRESVQMLVAHLSTYSEQYH